MDPRKSRDLAIETAAEWLVRLQAAELTRREREEFVDWLRESPLHVAEILRVLRVNGALRQFDGWSRIAAAATTDSEHASASVVPIRGGVPAPAPAPVMPRAVSGLRRLWLAAATLVLVVGATTAWLLTPHTQGFVTDRGELREVTLADGSVLNIGPESAVRVRLSRHKRQIALERGAVLFRVAKDAQRPFVVQMGSTLVRAVGTAFAVEQRSRDVVVTVAEGRIAVAQQPVSHVIGGTAFADWAAAGSGAPADHAQPAEAALHAVIVTAGQQIAVPATGRIGSVRPVDSERELAWASGRLVFQDEPLGSVVERFNKFNHLQLVVADEALARRTISGVFDAADPQSFIAFVESVIPVTVVRGDDGSITLGSSAAAVDAPKNANPN